MLRTNPALLPGASQGTQQAFHTLLPQCDGAPDERFSLHSSLVLPSYPGAGRCHLIVSSNPSHIGHPLFLTPRKEHVKDWSQTDTEARGAMHTPPGPLSSASVTRRNYSCTRESRFRRVGEGLGESTARCHGVASAPDKALKEQHRIKPSMFFSCQSPRKLPGSPGCAS